MPRALTWFGGQNRTGPTLRVKPGDVITLTLVNNLPPSSPEDKEKMKMMKAANPDPSSEDFASVTKIYNRLQDDGNINGEFWGHSYQNIHLHGIQVSDSSIAAPFPVS